MLCPSVCRKRDQPPSNALQKDFIPNFNACQSPKDASLVVQEAGLSLDTVGGLLYEAGDSVCVQLLGECLGHHSEVWKQLAVKYPENFACFAGMDVVAAIRAYLWCFRLPGEAAQIERIVDGFARSYFHYNSKEAEGEALRELHNEGKGRVVVDEEDLSENSEEGWVLVPRWNCWDAGVLGWYVEQPLSGPNRLLCCVHCGALEGEVGNLCACLGCNLVHFCRKCRKTASRYGHAVVGSIGYGRACVGAMRRAGLLDHDGQVTFQRKDGGSKSAIASVKERRWERGCPCTTQDSVMVLAYAIIMLTTNLHSKNVKEKMKKHEFLKQNRDVNGGGNFPGDFLSQVYDDIQQEELKVMRTVD